MTQEMEELTGKEVELKALHAGLECGVLGSKVGCGQQKMDWTLDIPSQRASE